MSFGTINKSMTVADAVKVNPELMDVLAKDRIDFCCGGGHPLAEAIAEIGKDVDAYIAMLNDVQVAQKSSRAEVLSYSKDQLIDYIVHTYHREQLNMIDEIDQGLAKLLNVHYDHHGEELTKIYQTFLQLKSALVPHFRHEEHVDFPEFKAGKPIDFDELRAEHEAAGVLLESLSALTNQYTAPADGCATYVYVFKTMKALEEGLHEHIFLENSVLFDMK